MSVRATIGPPGFEAIPEQDEPKRLLAAALAEGPAHAYLFHGPRGVGKRQLALGFAASLLDDPDRVERRCHPDLYVLEPLGDQIRIDAIRELRRDLHMRPFESARRVYLVFGADLLNEDAADALLKDLEEPPSYAVIVLVADELGSLPETLRSRCQLVAFRRLSHRSVERVIRESRPDLPPHVVATAARVAGGRIDRARRLLDESAAERRLEVIALARSVYLDRTFDPGAAAKRVVAAAREAAAAARADAEAVEDESETPREREQRLKRVARGVEREELVETLDVLASWYRDLAVAATGATAAILNADQLVALAEDGRLVGVSSAIRATEAVAETRRRFELNLNASLAFEALFIEVHRAVAVRG